MEEKNKIEITPEEFFNATQAIMHRVEKKLDRVLAYIDKVESPQYTQALDNKEIFINLLANAVITKLFAMFNNGQNQMQ